MSEPGVKEYNLYEAIERISIRTGMYTWDRNLQNIGSYIYGYAQAMEDAGFKEITYPRFENFRAWIKGRFDFSSDRPGWENMILAIAIGCDPTEQIEQLVWEEMDNATDEEHLKSVKLFFDLIEEYKNDISAG